jgi:hypothetical protein
MNILYLWFEILEMWGINLQKNIIFQSINLGDYR